MIFSRSRTAMIGLHPTTLVERILATRSFLSYLSVYTMGTGRIKRIERLRAGLLAAIFGGLLAIAPEGQAQRSSDASAPPVAVQQAITKSVESWLQGRFKVDSVRRTTMPGVYEVRLGADLIYVDEKGSHAIVEGQMIDLRSGKNLTALRLDEINAIDFAKLPVELALKTVTGNGSRQIAVFEDPYCSFCRRFRGTLMTLENVTIYTFFYPILRPESATVSKNAWCAKDRQAAWDDWMLSGKEPPAAASSCDFPKDKILALGKALNVQATPMSFVANGKRLQGAVSKEAIEAAFAGR
jgi:thiol:disulfide interchange protein DsbC